MTENITSLQNPRIKQLVKLRDRKTRDKTGYTLIDGLRELMLAVSSKQEIKEIFICSPLLDEKSYRIIKKQKVSVFEVPKKVFDKISYGDRQEGLLAVCQPKQSSITNLTLPKNPLCVVIEHLEKPGNLGAILRTCDGAGVDAVFACESLTDLYNPNVIRASLGTVFSVNTVVCTNEEAYGYFQDHNITSCATAPQAVTLYSQAPFKKGIAIILGSEHKGLSEFWKAKADLSVGIPMRGKIDSLNVSTTSAVLLYEALRQRSL